MKWLFKLWFRILIIMDETNDTENSWYFNNSKTVLINENDKSEILIDGNTIPDQPMQLDDENLDKTSKQYSTPVKVRIELLFDIHLAKHVYKYYGDMLHWSKICKLICRYTNRAWSHKLDKIIHFIASRLELDLEGCVGRFITI